MSHVIITGASRGLGAAVALRASNLGWDVSIGARSRVDLDTISKLLNPKQNNHANSLDVSIEKSVTEFFKNAVNHNGPASAVVHCAGIYGPFGPSNSIRADEWIRTIETNLMGTFYVARSAIDMMLEHNGGKVVLLSGGGATNPMPNISGYAASKAAVVRLMETLALEVQEHNIQINAVAPGLLDTAMLDEVIKAGPSAVGESFFKRMVQAKSDGADSMDNAVELILFLMNNNVPGLTGRLISSKWDEWRSWDANTSIFNSQDIFTLRRQVTP
ncbi:SDR family oxidoreductase [Acidithrix ferrooxidans]|uniref:Glucose 1-dehydrogenase n=1 Tax=Acidithrix ferrooxidans TaxID=1280514 RepID=A0A0D8HFL0_9ACTN|nr:SDR family oxidoreductase [Acidithrix ferrooxidans]KJF16755.1 glucose 1-dehydrogenase [Acidithrix ferrooxidans]